MAKERLDKLLAGQGTASRKEVKALIKKGNVRVNGAVCLLSERKIDPEEDKIEISGALLNFKRHVYIMMHKPPGVLSATNDLHAKTVLDLVPEALKRKGLFPAGRLDKDTEGLLLLTDDGDFAHRMLSPREKVYKRYEARVDKPITEDTVRAFEQGVVFADGTKCMPARLTACGEDKTHVQVEICQGMFHQVKKMFLCCGLRVLFLKRTAIGGLVLDGNLHKGQCRELTKREVEAVFISKMP